MRIVVISACEAGDRYVLRRLLASHHETHVLRPVRASSEASRLQTFARFARAPIGGLRAVYFRRHWKRRERRVTELLFNGDKKPVIPYEKVSAGDLNRSAGAEMLSSKEPDLLLLLGCPILGEEILAVARLGTVNLHFGIAPEYRGEHTLFFALKCRDFDHIVVTPGSVDSGPILAQACPAVIPADDEATIWAKLAQVGAEVVADLVTALEAGAPLSGAAQQGEGRLFRRRDRHVKHDVQHWWDRSVLHRHPPRQDGWLVKHYSLPEKGALSR
jgi:methionyl-tRNA formyltransferase